MHRKDLKGKDGCLNSIPADPCSVRLGMYSFKNVLSDKHDCGLFIWFSS